MPLPTQIDVAIIGSGPAGASAAHTLARAGIATAIFDKAPLPRYKTCGGGILFRAAKLLQDCPWQHTIEHHAHQVQLHLLDSNHSFLATRQIPLISMTMRDAFDHALTQNATATGALLFDACPVTGITDHDTHVEILTTRGTLRAQFVIGADGVRSIVAKAGRWPAIPRTIPALEWEVHVRPADFARFSRTPRFDFDLPAHGYAWVFPKRDHLSIGVLTTRPDRTNLNADCQTYLQRLGIHNPRNIQRHGYTIPVHPRPGPLVRNRLFLTGDAAGLADPITAEGITHAIRSGQLAAQALIAGKFHPPAAHRIYTNTLNREILSELRHARVLAKFLYAQPRLRTWLLSRHGQRLTDVMADIMTGQLAYAQVLRNPLNYLKLLRLK